MTTHIVNLFKGSYLNTLQIHTFNNSGANVLYNFSEATNSGYSIYNDAGTTKAQLFTTADNGTTWVPTPNSEISSLNNNYGSNFDLSNLSTNDANIVGTTTLADDGPDMSGPIEIFSSSNLMTIGITFFDDTSLTSGKYFSLSPNESEDPSAPKFYLTEWSNDNEGSVWEKTGFEDGGKSSHASPEALIQAFTDSSIVAVAKVDLNSDQPANLYTASSLANVGITPISNSISLADDSNIGYAVFTDISGTTKLLKYTKNVDTWSVDETAPNPIYANGNASSATGIVAPNLVGTGDVPNPFPDGVYVKSDLQTIFTADIAADHPATHFALRESHDNTFIFQPVKVEGMGFVVDGAQIKSAVAFNPSTLGNVTPTGSYTQEAAAADGAAADGGAADGAAADAGAVQHSIFGKVFQIDNNSHLDTLLENGHSLSTYQTYTFMMDDEDDLIISKVTLDAPSGKYIPFSGGSVTSALKSSYGDAETLSAYINAATSGFDQVGTMLKRVDTTDSSTTINLNDPDFEDTYDPASALELKHADQSSWQTKHVWSIEADAFKSGFPDASGYWMADEEQQAGEGATFTKVVSDGQGGFIPDSTHTPISFASDEIRTTVVSLNDANNVPQQYNIQDIAYRLSNNSSNSHIENNATYYDEFKMPPVDDTGSTLIDGVTPIYRDEQSSDLLIKLGDSFVNVRSEGITYQMTGSKDLAGLKAASINDLHVRKSDGGEMPLSDVITKMSGIVQPIPKVDVEIVIPLSDVFDYGQGYDNRAAFTGQINSLAFVPSEQSLDIFENVFVSFEKDFEGSLDKVSFKFTDGNSISSGSSTSNSISNDYYYNIVGNFDDLMNGGTLDVYYADGWVDSDSGSNGNFDAGEEIYNSDLGSISIDGVSAPQAYTIGTAANATGGTIVLPGGSNGYTAGIGNDYVMMNVSAISSYSGSYKGAGGYDYLDIKNDSGGMIVDFFAGTEGDNSAFVNWSEGGNTGFEMSGFEALFLSHGNDVVMIKEGVGVGLTTMYDTNHFIGSQSMFKIETGNADYDYQTSTLGTDYLYVNSDSNIYLSFNFAYDGVTATFNEVGADNKQTASISNNNINTFVEEKGGTGQLVDSIKTTGYNDVVINNGTTGITVDLAGNNSETSSTDSDVFIGSSVSKYDILDAREAFDFTFSETSINNPETSTTLTGINVVGSSEIETVIDADLVNVDYIMVRDDREDLGSITDDDLIWDSMKTADVDFYKDMSELYGEFQIKDLGQRSTDSYGYGYDVQTSALLASFGTDSDLRIYYDGDHSDFIDQYDKFSGSEGVYNMTLDDAAGRPDEGVSAYEIGRDWATQVEERTGGSSSTSFYVEVGGKKVAVSHDGTGWKVDNTALFIAQDASTNITKPTDMTAFSSKIADRYNIDYNVSDDGIGTFTNDIFLNATEQQIKDVLDSTDGVVTSTKAFNFGFYTKFDIGGSLINIKLTQVSGTQFSIDENDIDLMVENIFNRVDTDGAGVSSGGEVGNFVKVDNTDDIALGNGGDDTYVIEQSTMGTVLEYGDIDKSSGGLDNSDADSVNFASINSISALDFLRGERRNESTDGSLIIDDKGSSETVLFDNYNTFFDFRRIEYLTIDDAANNDEIFEISIDDNSGTDGVLDDLLWDNEIVVADNQGDIIYADDGTDVLVGGSGNDTFDLTKVVYGSTSDHSTMSHVHIKNITATDIIRRNDGDTIVNNSATDNMIAIQNSAGNSYMIFTDDESTLETYLNNATLV